jgi:hypothetical protein
LEAQTAKAKIRKILANKVGGEMAKMHGLTRVVLETLSTEAVALILTNENKKTFRTAVGPEGLNALLGPLLKCIGLWAAKPALAVDTLVGPKNSIAAQKISFQKGLNATEVAVRLHLGDKVQMVFLLPLDVLSLAILDLDRAMGPPAADTAKH